MKDLFKTIGVGMLGLVLATGCTNNKQPPSQFTTFEGVPGEFGHFYEAQMKIRRFNGGWVDKGEDLDFDFDGMNDSYIVAKDGSVYHTRSRRLLDGQDTASQRTWYSNSLDSLEYASKSD